MRKTRRTRPAAHRIGSRQGTACCAPTTHKKEAGVDFWNTVRLAFRALARNKLRSSLTMLGIIIGVGAVIATVSIGQGAEYLVQQGIQSMGTNAVFISAGSNRPGGARLGSWAVKTLTIDDMNAILREVSLIREAAPAVISRVQVVYQNQNWNTTIQGTTPNFFGIRSWPVQAGSAFGDEEVDSAADVCVLGTTVAGYLFGTESPVGKQIRIRQGDDDDFFVRTQSEVADLAAQTQQVMTLLLGSIASVSLIVGGIGIMNIMLVSVTERTREIGVRMAVGATEADVQLQFLVEAVTLSMLGGAVGIIAGLGGSALISNFLSWPTLISAKAIVAAAVFSAAVGVFFGFYPARKAAQLDPIEALRYE